MKCGICKRGEHRCHRCADCDGYVMPHCMGTAALSGRPRDLSACTCPRPPKAAELACIVSNLSARLDNLELAVATIPGLASLVFPVKPRT